jgi:hypothetical protein
MPALHLLPLADVLGVVPVLATDVLRRLRMIKDAVEIDALRKAGGAIDRVHARVPEFLVPGRTEADVAADIAEAIVAEGHSEVAFHRRLRAARGRPAPRVLDRELRAVTRRRRHRRPVRTRLQLRLNQTYSIGGHHPKWRRDIRCGARSRRPSTRYGQGLPRTGRGRA